MKLTLLMITLVFGSNLAFAFDFDDIRVGPPSNQIPEGWNRVGTNQSEAHRCTSAEADVCNRKRAKAFQESCINYIEFVTLQTNNDGSVADRDYN